VHNEDDIIDRIDQLKAFLQQHPTAHGLVILDDCKVFFNDKKNKKFFEEIGAVNRKFRLSFIVVLQSLQNSPTGFRQCIDSIFVTEGRGKTLPLVKEITGMKDLESLYEENMEGAHNHRNVLRLNIPANMPKWQLVRPPKAPLFALRSSI
jgi:hypothetical protein